MRQTIQTVGHLFREVGIRRLVTINIHSSEALALISIPAYSFNAVPTIAEYVAANYQLNNPIAVSPDSGGSQRVESFARIIKSDFVVFKKHRDRHPGSVSIEEQNLNLSGCDAIISEDLFSSGRTLIKYTELLKKYGACKVIVRCVHALPPVVAVIQKRFDSGVDEIISSNTVPSKYSKVESVQF